MSTTTRLLALLLVSVASAAGAQLLPSVSLPGGGGSPVGDTVGSIGSIGRTVDQAIGGAPVNALPGQVTRADVQQAIDPSLARLATERWVQTAPPATLLDLRRLRLAELVNENRATLEMDGAGNPARRGQLIAIDQTPASLAAAVRGGFTVRSDELEPGLGIRSSQVAILCLSIRDRIQFRRSRR